MVPKEWKLRPIKELCDEIIDCVNKTAPVVDYETPYKMIRTTNVRHGKIDTKNVRYVDELIYEKWTRRGAPKKGDLIFTREAPVGEVGILKNSEKLFLGQRTMMYRCNANICSNHYLLYSLQSRFCQKQIEDFSNGGTVAHMRVPDCGEIIIRVPPLPEQKKIAKILSTWDKAISITEQLLTNSQQQKKALMQQLLTGKKRFPYFTKSWKNIALNEIFEFKKGNGLSKDLITTLGKNKCILYGELYTRYQEVITDIINRTDSENGLSSKKGDILIPCSTTTSGIDLAKATAIDESNVLLGGDINVLRPKKNINSAFIAHLLTHIKKHEIASRAQGVTIIHLYGKDLKEIEITMPADIEEQNMVATLLSKSDEEIKILQNNLKLLKQEKKSLMQQLLTGKRRVKIDEKEETHV